MAACFGLMFLFVWLEGQLIRNNTRANALTVEIDDVKASIAKLEEQEDRLNSMERMEQNLNHMEEMEHYGPDLLLREAEPGQIVRIRGGDRRESRARTRSEIAGRRSALPTRSVVIPLGPPEGLNGDTTRDREVARLGLEQGAPGQG